MSASCSRPPIAAWIMLAAASATFCRLADLAAAEPAAVVVRLDGRNRIAIEMVPEADGAFTAQGPGLIIWQGEQAERSRALGAEPQRVAPDDAKASLQLAGGVRGDETAAGSFTALAPTALDQLLGYRVVRGAGLLTPPAGALLLDGRVVFRRAPPGKAEPKLEEATYQLRQSGKSLGEMKFAAGATTLVLNDVTGLPDAMRQSLPAGDYELRPARGAPIRFQIAESDHPDVIKLRSLAEACGGEAADVFALCAAQFLLTSRNVELAAQPYLTDALAIVERQLSASGTTPALERLRIGILARLQGREANEAAMVDDPVGIAAIDEARGDIATGRWAEARKRLEAAEKNGDTRVRRLVQLYLAVLEAEAGAANVAVAAKQFQTVIEQLSAATDDQAKRDLARARNNYANFLASLALDRLQNQAFQAATGVRGPLTDGLAAWREARAQYEAALEAADSPERRAATEVNLAQLYALLADVVRTIGDPENSAEVREVLNQAIAESRRLAAAAITTGTDSVKAAAHSLLAEIAFRSEDGAELKRHAAAARKLYAAEGILAGIESVERTEGLFLAREARNAPSQRPAALRHLQLSQTLAELLRDELPVDQVGMSRAGFFARRVFVNERMIELLIAEGRQLKALRIAEAAKARSLNDVLRVAAAASEAKSVRETPDDTDHPVADWPRGVAAVEYYIGSQKAWVFVVDVNGKVESYELRNDDGTPLGPPQLVARLTEFLQSMRAQATTMLARLEAGRGYDHSWQDELAWFADRLLPKEARAKLRGAETVLIVPHHVLHYFPFAALVVERDHARRSSEEMVAPRFLIDQSFDIAYAPSLAVWRHLRLLDDAPVAEARAVGISDFRGRAPNLEGVKSDLENLRAAFGGKVRDVVAEDEAVQAKAIDLLGRSGLLLFATHGSNLADRPLESNLRLSVDDGGDDRLTADELYRTDVFADLVVLSACFSGLADRSPLPSDDLFGVQRAFLHSGARCVVSGLWDVFDTTGVELMNDFFQQLAAGKRAPQALAAAQRAFLAKYREANKSAAEPFIHPYFWAVYTSIGDDRVAVAGGKN